MRVITPQRRHLTALAVLVATSLTVGLVVSVWTTASDSSPGSEAPAPTPTETYSDPRGAVTDAGPNPWVLNDPATILRFLEERCPGAPSLTPEMVDELIRTLEMCLGR